MNKNKDKKELLVKYLENNLVELKNNEIYLDSCETIKDKIIYAKTFIHGFGKSNSKFIIAFLNCFDDKDIDKHLFMLYYLYEQMFEVGYDNKFTH